MLAYMSTRVLGQYDLLIRDEDPQDQDLVYYVGPNVGGDGGTARVHRPASSGSGWPSMR